MTLHEAIIVVLSETNKSLSSSQIAELVNRRKLYERGDGLPIPASQISARINKYPDLFIRATGLISLKDRIFSSMPNSDKPVVNESLRTSRVGSDEAYIIDLCDELLGMKASRHHTFDFLKGDTGKPLPIDAYYPGLNLVIEYCERQHTEEVTFFDKPWKMTVSGVSRGEQRKIYDQRRRELLPEHNITLKEIQYSSFSVGKNKRIIQDKASDSKTLIRLLDKYDSE